MKSDFIGFLQDDLPYAKSPAQFDGNALRVLHLASWYPNPSSPHQTPFVREHFAAAGLSGEHRLVHVEVRYRRGVPRLQVGHLSKREHHLLLFVPVRQTRIVELLTVGLLVLLRLRLGRRWWNVVHVHVAWPLLRFPRLFMGLFGRRVCITEHWSAYRSHFHLTPGSPGHRRLARMFSHDLCVMTVSQALADDIRRFAADYVFPTAVVPNVVDPALFFPPATRQHDPPFRFLMVASWARIKRPLLALEAFRRLLAAGQAADLRIVGEGEQWNDMAAFVAAHGLAAHVAFLGSLSKTEIAQEMRAASALLHPSDYETFSVVCAEALSCGTPVIASKLDAIEALVDQSNGLLVDNDEASWHSALQTFCALRGTWDHTTIASTTHARFRPEVVGAAMHRVYRNLLKR